MLIPASTYSASSSLVGAVIDPLSPMASLCLTSADTCSEAAGFDRLMLEHLAERRRRRRDRVVRAEHLPGHGTRRSLPCSAASVVTMLYSMRTFRWG